MKPSFTIPLTQFNDFCKIWLVNDEVRKHLRFGQAFYNYANLHKMRQLPFHATLYTVRDQDEAINLIETIIDYEN